MFLPIFVFKTCHYVKSYKPCKNKKNQHRESLLVKVLILFYFYTATAVHEVDAARLRMCMAQFLGSCSQGYVFVFAFIRRQPYMK